MLNLIVVRKSIGMMPRVTVTVFCFESGGGSYEMVGDRGHVNEQALRQVDLALTTGDSGISITAGASAMENSLAEKVTRQVNDALQPLFSHATVNWGVWEDFLKYPTSPAVAQAVFSGDRRLFFAMLLPRLGDRRLPPTSIVTVEAERPDGTVQRVQMKVSLTPSALVVRPDSEVALPDAMDATRSDLRHYGVRHCQGRLVHCAAARSIIRDWESHVDGRRKAEAVELATRLVSPWQSPIHCRYPSIRSSIIVFAIAPSMTDGAVFPLHLQRWHRMQMDVAAGRGRSARASGCRRRG